jgi:predicted  nucleic acid-binding Zn-ribbon protein
MSHDPMTSRTAPPQEPYTAHSTTISAAALAARVRALEGDLETAEGSIRRLMEQLRAAQRDNTRLVERIVELEHERDEARRGRGHRE